ncbi:aldehyde dehydrogenase [Legionella longbeachae]|uniref:Aldehyde dehydrogenase n=1 Tax=Legionella longbeachae serogroup 1 (strain NSW150) TaxID=661367 RepID=D3HKE4_LEGLN|nr:aldehyde dehydrogenase [Legionella longbeachae]VEE03425.1 aldehyde dehydrogenase [Legionella oakridgensis]HBD7397701.1 aldehyde dehydrogenase [Legionella pneumophila]ARB93681.1 aldehyde dehydrogenase [Legionella longbeachae]EEZ93970.1 aldehyde dehydrogenase (NAD) family protein [Legionella longbeachae D-4968]QEY52321.1 aldehyde dehydrogenase [Legionella longbeachae]
MDIHTVVEAQRKFAMAGQAKKILFRKQQLQKLKDILKQKEQELFQALYADIKKSQFETYLTELALIYHEIDKAIKYVAKWSKPIKIRTGLVNQPGKSFILPEPYGTTLIIGAWNYPYQLTLSPLVAAIAAGNTSIIKPSELTKNTSSVIAQIINQNFDSDYLHVVEGGVEITQELLSHRFDKLFFTGSTAVGKVVAKAAAEHLTPVTLELGGKSPCIVFSDADLKTSAQRIVWGKFLNAGQTCIAPDYLLVEDSIYHPLLAELKNQLNKIIGPNPIDSESYVRIIDQKHVQRLKKLIDPQKVYVGGQVIEAENYIEPTILKDVDFTDEIMKEEIFGPILPVIPFSELKPILQELKARPRPLALYVFGKNQQLPTQVIHEVSFGGGCINDVLMHICDSNLPFGGVGESGMGSYHGEAGFKSFSHFKSIVKKSFWFEPPIKYKPYNQLKLRIIRALLG